MEYRETNHYKLTDADLLACSYCHMQRFQEDDFDEFGGYLGQYFQCNCEEAKKELQMNIEIQKAYELYEKTVKEIKDKYNLIYDYKEILRRTKEAQIQEIEDEYNREIEYIDSEDNS